MQLLRGNAVRKNKKARFLPIVVLLAVMPAILLPTLRGFHLPGAVIGIALALFLGLALASLIWLVVPDRDDSFGG